ncbi:DUF6055 domain-containing protein [Hallella seregens]|uniref:DUF6055 domain-containing protein n=1 Tax=Hallella seregens ATCC 51272 TaxID=1336250 RepID=A0ABV5ZJA3_9BACT|nr:DUF6055 domain-containing protein [Hallella seregens]
MKQLLLSMTLTATAVWPAMAQDPFEALSVPSENPTTATQKLVFVPDSLKPYDFNDDNARWCWRHSAQTQNVVYFWEKPFGDDTSNPPLLDGQPMKFDIGNLQNRVERFYRFFRDTLKFALPGSLCEKYKMMVMVNYSLEGTAYGGTFDNFIGALWVTPNRIQDRKLNCLAHELGHSFQAQIMADRAGEAWGGTGFFEMTSQWMLWRVNPDWLTDENYHFEAFKKLTHKGFLHSENIYHSPYVIEWWAEKHGLPSIAQLFREGKLGEDPVITYKRKYGMTQKQFNDEMFDCYRHLVNFDFDYARRETREYACTFSTPMQKQTNGCLRPAEDCIPENYGFNAIRLDVPQSGKKVTVGFRALVRSNSKGKVEHSIGYRYGLVGVTADDRCIYGQVGEAVKGEVTFAAPRNQSLKVLYLVVMGAPTNHSQDPSSRRFPYEVKIR